jgi:hypothetical protein
MKERKTFLADSFGVSKSEMGEGYDLVTVDSNEWGYLMV